MEELKFRVKLHGKLVEGENVTDELKKDVTTAMLFAGMAVQARVQKETPVGVSGNLRRSIFTEWQSGGFFGKQIISSPLEYAPPVESGQKPHWPPPGSLELWVRRKLQIPTEEVKSVAFLVARKISKKGTKGKLMFKKAHDALERKVNSMLENAVKKFTESV